MFKTILLSLLLLQTLRGQCSKGCLRCRAKSTTDTTKVCKICDSVANYYLKDDGTCAVSDQKNCELLNHDNTCGLCSPNYYVDNGKCVAVDVAKKVTNCSYYDSSQNCLFCATNYLLTTNTCVVVTTPIANCFIYQTQTECNTCMTNFYLSDDAKSCKSLPSDCLGYSEADCTTCQGGYVKNKNLYKILYYLFDTNAQRDDWYLTLHLATDNSRNIMSFSSCQAVTALNCLTYTDFQTCATCVPGYYQDSTSSKCLIYPESIIPNCSVYQFMSATKWQYKCVQCQENFYLENNKSCKAVTAVTDCISYDTTANTSVCLNCIETKVLSSGNCTTARTAIENCQTHHASQNKCVTCKSGYILNTEQTACKIALANCKLYNSFTASVASLTCNQCNDGFYLNNDGTCAQGSLNCLVYSSQTACTICANQYYPSPNCDQKHTAIDKCSLYSQSTANRCLLCDNTSTPIFIGQKCYNYTAILNCQTHSTSVTNQTATVTCTKCSEGFELVTNACNAITSPTNCVRKAGNSCTQCKEGYYLATDKVSQAVSCLLVPNYIKADCATFPNKLNETTQFSDQACQVCNAGFYGYSDTVCVLKDTLKFFTANAPADLTTLNNCSFFNNDGKCNRCSSSTYIDVNGACSATCTSTITYINRSGDTLAINQCIGAAAQLGNAENPNTLLVAVDLADDPNKIAYACKADYLTVYVENGGYTNLNPRKLNLSNTEEVIHNIAAQHQQVKCPAFAANDYMNATKLTVAPAAQPTGKDREIWNKETIDIGGNQNVYKRIACGWLKEGTITNDANVGNYLACANTTSANFDDVRYGGLRSKWSNLFNVHKCVTTNSVKKIPVIAYEHDDGAFKQYKPYGFSAADLTAGQAPQKNIFCLNITNVASVKADLGGFPADAKINILANCGLGYLDLKTLTALGNFDNTGYSIANSNDRTGKENLACVACQPGYKSNSNYVVDADIFVRQCTAITNCKLDASQTIFNGCSQCNDNFVWSSNASGIVSFDTCVSIPTTLKNCLAYNQDTNDNTKGTCIFCERGYSLTPDGYCEKITVSQCVGGWYPEPATGSLSVVNFLSKDGYHCQLCDTNYILYNDNRTFCGSIPSLLNSADKNFSQIKVISNTQTRTTNNLIDRCVKYETSGVCSECFSGYILSLNQQYCLQKVTNNTQTLANCTYANNDLNTCNTCDASYSLVQGQGCQQGNIGNCKTYNSNVTNQSGVVCIECQNGYWLKTVGQTTTCVQGKIPSCSVYSDEHLCSQCETNYWLVTSANSNESMYCIPKDTSTGCATIKASQTADNSRNTSYNYLTIQCNTCDGANTFIANTPTTEVFSKCLSINTTPASCKTYSAIQNIDDNGFSYQCIECVADSFLSEVNPSYACKKRTNYEITNCKTYSLSSDQCALCNTGFYLNNNNTACLANPTGNYQCITYDNSLKCTQCEVDFFLSSGNCVAVTNKVTNCSYYSNDKICIQCNAGYYLTNATTCELYSSGLNCLTYEAKDSCASCPPNYKLTTTNSKKSCVAVTITTKCLAVNVDTGSCTVCDKDYYVNATGTCTLANPLIVGCIEMNSSTTCKTCAANYALSVDGKTCRLDKGLSANCQVGSVVSTPVCTVCKAGYKFSTATATSCTKNSNATIENGCFDEASDKSCEVCISGWTMGTDGKCTNNNPAPQPSSGMISMISMFIALLFLQ